MAEHLDVPPIDLDRLQVPEEMREIFPVELARETGNYQRLRVHDLDGDLPVSALRLRVEATNGADTARLCGFRVYEQTPNW